MAGMTEYRAKSQDSFWTWRTLMYRFLDQLTPEHIGAIAGQVFMEMLEAGYASVGEFHYVHHQSGEPTMNHKPNLVTVNAAAKETGIGLTHPPVLYTYGGAGQQALVGGQTRFGHHWINLLICARASIKLPDATLILFLESHPIPYEPRLTN